MRRTRPKQNALIAPNPGENLRSGTTASDQPATAGTVGGGLRCRRCLVVGWSVLPGDRLWPRRGTPQRSLQHKAGVQGLHASLGPLWTLIHQLIPAKASEALHYAGCVALSPERRFKAPASHRWRRRFRSSLCPVQLARRPVRTTHSRPEAPTTL